MPWIRDPLLSDGDREIVMKLDKPTDESKLLRSQEKQETSDKRIEEPHRKSELLLNDLIDFLPMPHWLLIVRERSSSGIELLRE